MNGFQYQTGGIEGPLHDDLGGRRLASNPLLHAFVVSLFRFSPRGRRLIKHLLLRVTMHLFDTSLMAM